MLHILKQHFAGAVAIALAVAAIAGITFAYRNTSTRERERNALRGIGSTPTAVLSATKFDWGDINRNTIVEASFMLRNEGTAVLNVTFLATSCSCTTAELLIDDAPAPIPAVIPSGGNGVIRVTFDPAAHESRGVTERAVRIETNDPDNPFLVITLHAYVR